MVYLLHFDRPYKHARHYIGYTDIPIQERWARHRRGGGARLIQVITEAGIEFVVAKIWVLGGRQLERQLKRRKGASRFCPICKELGLRTNPIESVLLVTPFEQGEIEIEPLDCEYCSANPPPFYEWRKLSESHYRLETPEVSGDTFLYKGRRGPEYRKFRLTWKWLVYDHVKKTYTNEGFANTLDEAIEAAMEAMRL